METRNMMIGGIWAFVIIWLVGTFLVRGDLLISMMLFFLAIVFSFIAFSLPIKNETKTVAFNGNLSKQVEEVKKTTGT